MEYAALISFALLIVAWMALPSGAQTVLEEAAPAVRTQTFGVKA
jgi:hypothetical protein